MKIRPAQVKDVTQIAQIINHWAEYGVMLHRSLNNLYENIKNFNVAIEDDRVVGVCGLKIVWSNLSEVYALAVAKSHQGKGIGRKLVRACIDDAHTLGVKKLMTLTYEQKFFDRLGFKLIDRQNLPLKVWSECLTCSKNNACDEIAMMLTLDIPEVHSNVPNQPPSGTYEVPVTISITAPSKGPKQKMDDQK